MVRFTLTQNIDEDPFDWAIMDNEKDCLITAYTGKPVVDLLNKLDSVNKLLKSKNENLKEMFEQSEERANHWKSLYESLYEKVGGNYGKES